MLGNIRDVTTALVVGLVMLVALLVFFMMTLEGSELNLDNYQIGEQRFKSCANDYQQSRDLYQAYNNQAVLNANVKNLTIMREQLDIGEACSSDYVVSSDEQITTYAEAVYQELTTRYPNQQFGLLDTVYTAPAKYYAYTGNPQDYLFFALSSDETQLMAYVYKPGTNPQITELWTIDQASNIEEVQSYTNNILVKYYEKVM